jgi:hypothetical protein
MFLKSYTELPVSFEDVRAAILRRSRPWLDGLVDVASQDGERMLVEVGLEVGGRAVARSAWLEVGEPLTTDRTASLPLHMRLQDHERLFPSLEGCLDAAWLGPGRTHLALTVQYDPPLGILGRSIDRALLHRVAEAVARHFLETVAQRLTARSNADLDRGPPGKPH